MSAPSPALPRALTPEVSVAALNSSSCAPSSARESATRTGSCSDVSTATPPWPACSLSANESASAARRRASRAGPERRRSTSSRVRPAERYASRSLSTSRSAADRIPRACGPRRGGECGEVSVDRLRFGPRRGGDGWQRRWRHRVDAGCSRASTCDTSRTRTRTEASTHRHAFAADLHPRRLIARTHGISAPRACIAVSHRDARQRGDPARG